MTWEARQDATPFHLGLGLDATSRELHVPARTFGLLQRHISPSHRPSPSAEPFQNATGPMGNGETGCRAYQNAFLRHTRRDFEFRAANILGVWYRAALVSGVITGAGLIRSLSTSAHPLVTVGRAGMISSLDL